MKTILLKLFITKNRGGLAPYKLAKHRTETDPDTAPKAFDMNQLIIIKLTFRCHDKFTAKMLYFDAIRLFG